MRQFKVYKNETEKITDKVYNTDSLTFSVNEDELFDMAISRIDIGECNFGRDALGAYRPKDIVRVDTEYGRRIWISPAYFTLCEKLVEKGILDKSFFKMDYITTYDDGDEYKKALPYTDIMRDRHLSSVSDYLLEKGWVITKEKDTHGSTYPNNVVSTFVHIGNDHIVNVAFKRVDGVLHIRLLPLKGKRSLTWYHLDTMFRDQVLATVAFPFQAAIAESVSNGITHKIEWKVSDTNRYYVSHTEYDRYFVKTKHNNIMCFKENGVFDSPLNINVDAEEWIPFHEFLFIMTGIKDSKDRFITKIRDNCIKSTVKPYTISYWNPNEERMFDDEEQMNESLIFSRECCGIHHQYKDDKDIPDSNKMLDPIFSILATPECSDVNTAIEPSVVIED